MALDTKLTTHLSRSGNVVTFGKNRYWPERGVIHIEDVQTGDYKTITVKQALERVKGINDMVANTVASRGTFYAADEVEAHRRFVEHMIELIKIAKDQGEPGSASSIREAKLRSRKTIVVPSPGAFF